MCGYAFIDIARSCGSSIGNVLKNFPTVFILTSNVFHQSLSIFAPPQNLILYLRLALAFLVVRYRCMPQLYLLSHLFETNHASQCEMADLWGFAYISPRTSDARIFPCTCWPWSCLWKNPAQVPLHV